MLALESSLSKDRIIRLIFKTINEFAIRNFREKIVEIRCYLVWLTMLDESKSFVYYDRTVMLIISIIIFSLLVWTMCLFFSVSSASISRIRVLLIYAQLADRDNLILDIESRNILIHIACIGCECGSVSGSFYSNDFCITQGD